jgi:hypothetical protein
MKKLLFVASIAVTLMPVGAFAAKKPNENIGHLMYDHGYWRPWSKIVADATVMSARHNVENRGHPLKFHSCEPEDKQKCSDSIIIGLDNNDPPWKFMVVITDRDQGVETGRLCWFTADHKTRQCMAWGDPGDGPIEKFNDAGEWVIEGKDNATEARRWTVLPTRQIVLLIRDLSKNTAALCQMKLTPSECVAAPSISISVCELGTRTSKNRKRKKKDRTVMSSHRRTRGVVP